LMAARMALSDPDVSDGSRTAVAGRLMAQPVYPQLQKYSCVPALTLRAQEPK
jgi:hypothetical protein